MKKNINKKHKFDVIKGGQLFSQPDALYKAPLFFRSAYATNTFLHREICMHIVWDGIGLDDKPLTAHELIYYSYTESAFIHYRLDVSTYHKELDELEFSLIENLGANKISINEKTARYFFKDFLKNFGIDDLDDNECEDEDDDGASIQMILESPLNTDSNILSKKEFEHIVHKFCHIPTKPFALINTFLLNYIQSSMAATHLLCTKEFTIPKTIFDPSSIMLRNKIEKLENNNYFCDALIFDDECYQIATFKISLDLKKIKISNFEISSAFEISQAEASMILSRSEYVTVFNLHSNDTDNDMVYDALSTITHNAIPAKYSAGSLFSVLDPDLNYLDSPTFIVRDEYLGSIFLNNANQLILTSMNKDNIMLLERSVAYSKMNTRLTPFGRYEFKEPMFYDYLYSNFILFQDFVSFFQE